MKILKLPFYILTILIYFSSCKKENKNENSYYDPNFIIVGDWRLYETIESDGTVYTLNDNEHISLKLEANGNATEIHIYSSTNDTTYYIWELSDDNKKLKLLDPIDLDSNELNIAKLAYEELWFSEPDGYQVHFNRIQE